MLKLQRTFLILLSVLFLALTASLILQNQAQLTPVTLLEWHFTNVSLSIFALVASVSLGLSIGFKMGENALALKTQQKKTSRELERRSVTSDEAEARVSVLESKIQTLEKALSEALKR